MFVDEYIRLYTMYNHRELLLSPVAIYLLPSKLSEVSYWTEASIEMAFTPEELQEAKLLGRNYHLANYALFGFPTSMEHKRQIEAEAAAEAGEQSRRF